MKNQRKRLRPKDIAEFEGSNPQSVRERMKKGLLPIGEVRKSDSGQYIYEISPKKASEYYGYSFTGYEEQNLPPKSEKNADIEFIHTFAESFTQAFVMAFESTYKQHKAKNGGVEK